MITRSVVLNWIRFSGKRWQLARKIKGIEDVGRAGCQKTIGGHTLGFVGQWEWSGRSGEWQLAST